MKLKIGQWGEYDFDKEGAKIVIPLILLVPALAFTQLRKDWLIGGAAAYYLLYFFMPPCFLAIKGLFEKVRHWRTFRCPYCKSHEIILQGMQEFHGDIPYDHYFCNHCRETSVFVNTAGVDKMIAPSPSKLKQRSLRSLIP